MQQVEQTRNIFGFPVANEDDRLFEKTASFFCPCPTEKKEETSFSTVVTDETKENSAPVTPEKSKRVKICKISTKTPAAFAKNIGAFSNLGSFGDTFGKNNNKLPLIIKSNDSTTLKQIQDIRTILPRVFFSQRSQRPSKSVNESASEVKYQAKDLIFTTDVSFETENILNLNKTSIESETVPTQADTLDQKITAKNFVIKKSNKNKIQISKFNKIGTFNPLSNSHNLAPSTTEKLPETEINHLQQKIVEKLKPRYLTIEADTSDISKRTIQSIISQIPQSFTFEENVQKKLGSLKHLPKTTTNADLMKNFKPVITPKRDLNSIKLRAQSPNMMTSLDLNSLVSPKAANTRIPRYPASEVFDTQPHPLSKRPSSRFRPQEDLLEKLFNPANQKKKN